MRVILPFTERHPETEAGAPAWAEWVDVSADDEAYWRTLCEWWERGEDFVVIEHDVVCRPDIIEGFDGCPSPWCAHKYDGMCHESCSEAWANHLGCTRFRKEIMAAVPDAVSSITNPEYRDWHNVCDGIGGAYREQTHPGALYLAAQEGLGNTLRDAGYTHHWHAGDVDHLPMRKAG